MKLEPAGRARFAGVVWIAVGVMLLARAWSYFLALNPDPTAAAVTGKQIGVAAAALILGGAKGWFVLRKASKRMITRMEANPGPQWVWQIWPVYYLPLIGVMIGGGLALRHFAGPTYPSAVVLVYFGVGAALLTSSVPYFQAAGRLASGEAAPTPAGEEATG